MNVSELNEDQLEELRESYFYQLLEMDEDVLGEIDFPQKIPMSNVLNHYEGVYFVEEDFSCSTIENNIEQTIENNLLVTKFLQQKKKI